MISHGQISALDKVVIESMKVPQDCVFVASVFSLTLILKIAGHFITKRKKRTFTLCSFVNVVFS